MKDEIFAISSYPSYVFNGAGALPAPEILKAYGRAGSIIDMAHSPGSNPEQFEFLPIEDYAIIGDCRCSALVGKNGSIDWLCLPRFDSPSVFAAILDPEKGGRFAIRPAGHYRVTRRYLEETNVLEHLFETDTGTVRLLDLMPVFTEETMRRELCPERFILRSVECLSGVVEMEVNYRPRPDYGQVVPKLESRGDLGFYCGRRGQALVLRSELPLYLSGNRSEATGNVILNQGERRFLSLTFSQSEPAVLPPLGRDAEKQIARTIDWWRGWTGLCTYRGPYREHVVRSALTLKLMVYSPSGAVIAAPTASLPEKAGGSANWDYRFCWLRDASMTLRAFFNLGYHIEGKSFFSWLVHTTRLTFPELRVFYNVYGEMRIKEIELAYLRGYRDSRPVRVGNAVVDQLQLDSYGELIEAAAEYVDRGHELDSTTSRVLVGLGKTVCRKWREPDAGIWESRSTPRHHTSSKVLCWVALDRLLRLHHQGKLKVPAGWFSREREALREEIEQKGYDYRQGTYTSTFGQSKIDASLLLLCRYGYQDPLEPRMVSTLKNIRARLEKNGLMMRSTPEYEGVPAGEGAFGAAGFWDVECRALQGDIRMARQKFENLLSYASDVGLYAEEIDVRTGAALGNFPQAYTHIGLVNAAARIAEYERIGATSSTRNPIRKRNDG